MLIFKLSSNRFESPKLAQAFKYISRPASHSNRAVRTTQRSLICSWQKKKGQEKVMQESWGTPQKPDRLWSDCICLTTETRQEHNDEHT